MSSDLTVSNGLSISLWIRPDALNNVHWLVSAFSIDGYYLRLDYRPPFDWASITGYLAARATPQVEFVSPEAYRRTISVDGQSGFLEVTPESGANRLVARIASAAAAIPS